MPVYDFPHGEQWQRAVEKAGAGDLRPFAELVERGIPIPKEHAHALGQALRELSRPRAGPALLPMDVAYIREHYAVAKGSGRGAATLYKQILADVFSVDIKTIEDVLSHRGAYK